MDNAQAVVTVAVLFGVFMGYRLARIVDKAKRYGWLGWPHDKAN